MQDRFRKFLTRQFGKPSGLIGKILGNRMARGNVYDAQWTVSLLDIQPEQRILEIGFGPGVSTQIAVERVPRVFVAGIDHSRTMVQAASQRNADAIRSGRMELREADVRSLPYPDHSFDRAFSLHSIYFWENPVDCLQEIKRVLKPSGLLAITIQPKDKWTPNVHPEAITLYFSDEIAAFFSAAGYREIRVEAPPRHGNNFLECILGLA
jgi:ubiquinone/menaquinone biosynthesis C-methylase UbiE